MTTESGPPPHEGPRCLAERIAASFERAAGEAPPSAARRLSRSEIDDLISRTLDEELERLGEPSPPQDPTRTSRD